MGPVRRSRGENLVSTDNGIIMGAAGSRCARRRPPAGQGTPPPGTDPATHRVRSAAPVLREVRRCRGGPRGTDRASGCAAGVAVAGRRRASGGAGVSLAPCLVVLLRDDVMLEREEAGRHPGDGVSRMSRSVTHETVTHGMRGEGNTHGVRHLMVVSFRGGRDSDSRGGIAVGAASGSHAAAAVRMALVHGALPGVATGLVKRCGERGSRQEISTTDAHRCTRMVWSPAGSFAAETDRRDLMSRATAAARGPSSLCIGG